MLHSAAESVFREVKELILSGELPGGELISEGEIAKRMECSRTPVREAFLRLEAEGWMRLYPKKGALVVPVADGEAEHVVAARQLVETQSVRVVAEQPHVRSALLDALRTSLIEQREIADRGDVVAFSAADADFHKMIVAAGGNPLLDTFYGGLRDRQRRMTARSIARDPGQLSQIIEDHTALADLVESGDADAYNTAVLAHMRQVHGLGFRGAL
ncbi:GntR family transcriptional regulator [Rhodococcus sp. SRB_17]|uniref:GntR family transcriptional regulator n=1 Tax=Rhodococcus sp. OK302 TaxID=1882769 RepID=UPI000B9409C0|nr:GntR family transcriptional regulator [Rhodococcus sp. OK302]NMM85930.1 GntR family transcriptional regulator [Rhodococcus sp. SRB_17]OYD67814.1 GntR family transcriptional regulator [Rhodococcus sp. OK302]